MLRFCALLILVVSICHGVQKIKLVEGVEKTVTFKGDTLQIRIEKASAYQEGQVFICFQSTDETAQHECPTGFARVKFWVHELKSNSIFEFYRNGTIIRDEFRNKVKNVQFGDDESIKIVMVEVPEGITVFLDNVDVVETVSEKARGPDKAVVGAVVGVVCAVVLILMILASGAAIWYFCFRKKSTLKYVPEDEIPQTINDGQIRSIVLPRDPKQKPEAKTIPIKKPSAEPTPNQTSIAPPTPASSSMLPLKPTLINEADVNPTMTPNPEPVKKASTNKSANPTTPTPAIPLEPPKSPPLKTDSTQSPTNRTPITEPTPDFAHDGIGNSLAKYSVCKAQNYLNPAEAPKPGQPRRRSLPVVDEVEDYRRSTETYFCFCQRMHMLGGHNHMRLKERVNAIALHLWSDAERGLIKADPKDAIKWASIVIKEAKDRIEKHCLYHQFDQVGFEEPRSFWYYINLRETPASDGYLVLRHLAPELFALKEHTLADPLIRVMPLCGIYILILDEKLPTSFRITLAAELRRRASRVIPHLQTDALRDACFPSNYMALAYAKNQNSFIEGKEIHSKSATSN